MESTSYRTMINTLKEAGYRLTPQRRAICRVLAASEEHPSAQMIYEQLRVEDESFNLATVYNTLDILGDLGAVSILGEVGSGDSVRYDGDTKPHVNLACLHCNKIIDISSQHIHSLADEIKQESGYAVLGARVLYYGICPECQEKSKTISVE